MSIAPTLDPRMSHPVTRPVIFIRRPAKESVTGNIEAIESPSPSVPIKMAPKERGIKRIRVKLIRLPKRQQTRIERGLKRVTKGIVNIRPKVSEPQNIDVRYAAVVASLNLNSTEYV